MQVLLVLLNRTGDAVLMKKNKPGSPFDFPYIIKEEFETDREAAERMCSNLKVRQDMPLHFVRSESITLHTGQCNRVCVMCGQLTESVDFDDEGFMFWVEVNRLDIFISESKRHGSCYVYLHDALKLLAEKVG